MRLHPQGDFMHQEHFNLRFDAFISVTTIVIIDSTDIRPIGHIIALKIDRATTFQLGPLVKQWE